MQLLICSFPAARQDAKKMAYNYFREVDRILTVQSYGSKSNWGDKIIMTFFNHYVFKITNIRA